MASDGLPVIATAPGFLIRRAQQMHLSIWLQHVGPAVTSVQFGVLLVLAQKHDLGQTGVAELMSLDKNTAADVLRRPRSRGLVTRTRDPDDGRRKMTRLSDDGVAILRQVIPEVSRVQDQLLSSLDSQDRRTTLTLLRSVAFGGKPLPDDTPAARGEAQPGLHTAPGHLIRRSQQLHTLYWAEDVSDELTSPQFTLLLTLCREPNASQARLGSQACLDKATCADVVSRLVGRGLLHRARDKFDGRRHKLSLTEAGRSALHAHVEGVRTVQRRLMAPLSPSEAHRFTAMMTKMVSNTTAAQSGWPQ